MTNTLLIIGVGLFLVLLYGIYKIASRGTHETNLYRTSGSANRRKTLSTIITIIVLLAGVFGLYFLIEYML